MLLQQYSEQNLDFCQHNWYTSLIQLIVNKVRLISKCPFGVFKSSKKNNEMVSSISALVSKKWWNQKSSVRGSKLNPPSSGIKCPLFLFDLFLEARAEILEKIHWIFWKIWIHQKDVLKLIGL